MKKILFIFALFFSFVSTSAQKDKLDQLFEKYQETEGVTSIKIAKPMFNMLNKLNINDSELDQIKPLLSKINGLKILIVEKPETPTTPGTNNQKKHGIFNSLQADISNSIKNMKYEELITVNSKDNKIKFLSSDATNGILDNLLLSINSEGNTVLMMLDGKISMDDVNNLVNQAQTASLQSSVNIENENTGGATQVRNVGKFSGIKVSSGIKANFTQGNNQSVIVETDPSLQQYISTQVVNDILVISVDNKYNKKLNFKKLLVTIEAPRLSSVKVSSGAQFNTLNTIKEDSFSVEVSSGANLSADVVARNVVALEVTSGSSATMDIETESFTMSGTSGSSSTIRGKSNSANFKLTSAASCNAADLVTGNATVAATSGSSLRVHTTDSISGTATSGASIRYRGNPKNMSGTKTSSGGSIKSL